MRLLLLGPPGAGKGTQGIRIAKKFKIPHIPIGDLLREHIANKTPMGLLARQAMDLGQAVPNDIMGDIIGQRLAEKDAKDGFILEGFPRNIAQANVLDALLHQKRHELDAALLIEVDLETLMARLTGRRFCGSCRREINIFINPPHFDDQCDDCGGALRQKMDDRESTINSRLRIFDTQTSALIERLRDQGRLHAVQGVGDVDDIFRAVNKTLVMLKKLGAFDSGIVKQKKKAASEEVIKKPASVTRSRLAPKGARKKIARKKVTKKKVTKKVAKKTAKKAVKKTPVKKSTRKVPKKTAKKKVKKKVAKKAVRKVLVKKAIRKTVKKAAKKKASKKKTKKKK